jgi:hypothetical protein
MSTLSRKLFFNKEAKLISREAALFIKVEYSHPQHLTQNNLEEAYRSLVNRFKEDIFEIYGIKSIEELPVPLRIITDGEGELKRNGMLLKNPMLVSYSSNKSENCEVLKNDSLDEVKTQLLFDPGEYPDEGKFLIEYGGSAPVYHAGRSKMHERLRDLFYDKMREHSNEHNGGILYPLVIVDADNSILMPALSTL